MSETPDLGDVEKGKMVEGVKVRYRGIEPENCLMQLDPIKLAKAMRDSGLTAKQLEKMTVVINNDEFGNLADWDQTASTLEISNPQMVNLGRSGAVEVLNLLDGQTAGKKTTKMKDVVKYLPNILSGQGKREFFKGNRDRRENYLRNAGSEGGIMRERALKLMEMKLRFAMEREISQAIAHEANHAKLTSRIFMGAFAGILAMETGMYAMTGGNVEATLGGTLAGVTLGVLGTKTAMERSAFMAERTYRQYLGSLRLNESVFSGQILNKQDYN